VLKGYGFKATIMAGLTIAGCGCLVFWPSAVLQSYEGFCISMFLVGMGLATWVPALVIFCGEANFSSELRALQICS